MKTKIAAVLIILGVLINGCNNSEKGTNLKLDKRNLSFSKISEEIDSVMDLFKIDNNTTIYFDEFEAKSRNVSKETIEISIGLVNISNELISEKLSINQKELKKSFKSTKLNENDLLNWFFDESKKIKEIDYIKDSDSKIKRLNKISIGFDATRICGSFWNPIPNVGGNWKNIYKSKKEADVNKFEKKLFRKGYHTTSSRYGGGYTKPVNYNSWICGNGSFRHHAYIYYNNSSKEYITREQSYSETHISGEPNPEIFTYSWPYAVWPAYVKWWHDWH